MSKRRRKSEYAGLKSVRDALDESRCELDCELPIAPVESDLISFEASLASGSPLGSVNAHPGVIPSALALSAVTKHVCRGRPAVFRLGPRLGAPESDPAALAALSPVIRARAVIQRPGDQTAAAAVAASSVPLPLLPFTCEPAVGGGGIDIRVSLPASAPDGSRVTCMSVSVAGCEVDLGEAPACVVVGFVHTPASEGPVMDAAEAGDLPALWGALDNGGSTEEADSVSVRHTCSDLTTAARPPARNPLRVSLS